MECILYYSMIVSVVWLAISITAINIAPAKFVINISAEDARVVDPESIAPSVGHFALPMHMLNKYWRIVRYSQYVCGIIVCLSIASMYTIYGKEVVC